MWEYGMQLFTHLNNVSLLASGGGKRQDAHVRDFVLLRPVQLQIVCETNVSVVGSVTFCRQRFMFVVEWCTKTNR